MARDQETVKCEVNVWTQLTNADVTSLTFQTLRGTAFIRATVGEATPTETEGIRYGKGSGESLARSIAEYITLVGANRLWAKPVGSVRCSVYVDHS